MVNIIEGAGDSGKMGSAQYHVGTDGWYLYVGTPTNRYGINIGVSEFLKIRTDAYFMCGTSLPGSPPPPPEVAQILGIDASKLNYMREENNLANGGGIAFGAKFSMDTGDINFLMFYASFKAGMGFDIMLKDYMGARCSNTGGAIGINGWYASGQAYAYLQGELGIQVRIFGSDKRFSIIKGGAAVLIQAKMPNPFWAHGYLAGNVNVMGGLIKASFRMEMELGEKCVFENAGDPLGGVKIIADITPKQDATAVDVFAEPQAVFTLPVGKDFVIPGEESEDTYMITLNQFKMYDGTKEIKGEIKWNSTKDRANFVTQEILPSTKPIKVVVEVSFAKLVNGVFQPVIVDGKPAIETMERSFTTGTAPTYIPLSNIKYCYPVIDQKYFLAEEYPQGYIQLTKGQAYLFDEKEWKTTVRIAKSTDRKPLSTDFHYDDKTQQVYYSLPNIEQGKKYTMSIMSSPAKGAQVVAATATTSTISGNEGTQIEVRQEQADNVSRDGEIERLQYDFATSKYRTFTEKMNGVSNTEYNFTILYSDVITLSNSYTSQEAFEIVDLVGSDYTGHKENSTETASLITAEAMLDDLYFTQDMYPNLYENYPLDNKYLITNRVVTVFGTQPSKALSINSYYLTSLENNINASWTKSSFPFTYNLPLVYKGDWVDISTQIVNSYIEATTSEKAKEFIKKNFLFMRSGFYNISLKYCLPGSKKTTNYVYKYKNILSFR